MCFQTAFLLSAIKTIHQHEITPFARRQSAEFNLAHTDAFQADDAQADQFAHAADLTFFSLSQNKAQLVFVLPFDFGGAQFFSVQTQAVVEQGEAFVVQFAADTDEVFFFAAAVFANQLFGDAAVLGEYQQSDGVNVQAAGRG